MIRIIPTLDYEIHGNGCGCPRQLMTIPTRNLLNLFNQYGAKLTIMADIAEILKFREYLAAHGIDKYHYLEIEDQLKEAISCGHDVQLHLHSSYFNARYINGYWQQDWSEYDFARLGYERMNWMLNTGKKYLENLLQPVDKEYRCVAFRAANWSMQPSNVAIRALLNNGITIDSSVFKYGKRQHPVVFDYTQADSGLMPWPASHQDICIRDNSGSLIELPIYSESRNIMSFLTFNRLYRIIMNWSNRFPSHAASTNKKKNRSFPSRLSRFASLLRHNHAWKADFNQCSGYQLIQTLKKIQASQEKQNNPLIPFVLIGHSKLYNYWNEITLRPFLTYSSQYNQPFQYNTLLGISRELHELQINKCL